MADTNASPGERLTAEAAGRGHEEEARFCVLRFDNCGVVRGHVFDHTLTQWTDSVGLAHGEIQSELRLTAPRFSGRGSPALLLSSQPATGLSALAQDRAKAMASLLFASAIDVPSVQWGAQAAGR